MNHSESGLRGLLLLQLNNTSGVVSRTACYQRAMRQVIVPNQLAADAAREVMGPGVVVMIKGEMLDEQTLKSMTLDELRKYLLENYVPCSGLTTKDELLAALHRDWEHRMERPLAQRRDAALEKTIRTGKAMRCGLLQCRWKDCLNTEDGYVAFPHCANCRGPSYCSKECQTLHWHHQHKKECKRMQEELARADESNQQFSSIIQALSGIIK